MIEPQRGNPQSPFSLGLKFRFLLFPFGLLYRLWVSTIRFKFSDLDTKRRIEDLDVPVIITLWHNRLFLAGEWQRRFRKKRKCFGLISGSRDGAWLEAFYGWSGIHAVRGSSNRGGAQAIRLLVRKLKSGHDIGITPDGSRGPCYVAKPGGILVSKISKAPLLLLTFEYGASIKLKSWDRFVIPMPFSRVNVRTSIIYAQDMIKDHSVDEASGILSEELMKLTYD
jgi:lysophospholipid acyltransferase (LPLAT)-like uncharacterized protein